VKVPVSAAERADFLASISHAPLEPEIIVALRKTGVQSTAELAQMTDQAIGQVAGLNRETARYLRRLVHALHIRMQEIESDWTAPETQPDGHLKANVSYSEEASEELLSVQTASVPMSVRLRKRLGTHGVSTLADVLRVNEEEFSKIRGVGETTLAELRKLKADIRSGKVHIRAHDTAEPCRAGRSHLEGGPPVLVMPFDSLPMPVRLLSRLGEYGVATLADVLAVDDDKLAQMRGVGKRTISDLCVLRGRIYEAAGMDPAAEGPASVAGGSDTGARRTLAGAVASLPLECIVQDTDLLRALAEEGIVTASDIGACTAEKDGEPPTFQTKAIRRQLEALQGKVDQIDRNYRAHYGYSFGPLPREIEREMYQTSTSLREALAAYVNACLGSLSDRNRQIVLLRYGLTGTRRGRVTLATLAKRFALSRERVRQVVKKAEVRLAKSEYSHCLDRLLEAVRDILRESLGVARSDHVAGALRQRFGWEHDPARYEMKLLCKWMPDVALTSEGIIRHSGTCKGLREATMAKAVEMLSSNGRVRKLVNFRHDISRELRGKCWGDGSDDVFQHCDLPSRDNGVLLPLEYLRCVLRDCSPPVMDPDGEQVMGPDVWALRHARSSTEAVGQAAPLQQSGGLRSQAQ